MNEFLREETGCFNSINTEIYGVVFEIPSICVRIGRNLRWNGKVFLILAFDFKSDFSTDRNHIPTNVREEMGK